VRTSSRLLVAVLVGLVAAGGPAAAATDGADPIGGEQLGSAGVVVDEDGPALPEGLTAASWVVADLDSGKVLAAKDPHGRYAPASTLKTLTAVTLIPVLEADRKVVPTFDDIDVEGSKVGLVERVGYPVHELFSALMMVSGNDAANVLASAAGGQEATAALMNEKARSLHALDTRAVNPHGLDAEGQVSSAYDLALIARAGMADPAFAGYAAAKKGSVSAPGSARIEMYTKNKILKSYEGGLGIKNGYTSRARASFVGAAERDGRRIVVTLMRAQPNFWPEAVKLLDWGFAAAGDVEPVGELVDAEPSITEQAQDVVEELTRTAGGAAGSGATESTGLGTTLAGMGLAAAALLAVRHRPGSGSTPQARRPVPAQRPVPQRVPVRR
jgi:D-alanyl-D-alanine carboxypeptidase (penicillin-binding protein 5/6)